MGKLSKMVSFWTFAPSDVKNYSLQSKSLTLCKQRSLCGRDFSLALTTGSDRTCIAYVQAPWVFCLKAIHNTTQKHSFHKPAVMSILDLKHHAVNLREVLDGSHPVCWHQHVQAVVDSSTTLEDFHALFRVVEMPSRFHLVVIRRDDADEWVAIERYDFWIKVCLFVS